MRRICSVKDCGKYHKAKGYCTNHYNRWRAWGDPLHVPTHKASHTGKAYIESQAHRRAPNHRLWDNYIARDVVDEQTLHLREGIAQFRRLLDYRHTFLP